MLSSVSVASLVSLLACKAMAQSSTIPYAEVANGLSQTIYFELVDATGVIDTSSIDPGSSHEITLSEQVSMKMDLDGSFTSPYQFEFNYDPSTGFTYYDFSAINGNPFTGDPRNITPTDSSCEVISCNAGDASNDCQYTDPTNFGAPGCGGTGSNQATLNVVIGPGSLTKMKGRRAVPFTA